MKIEETISAKPSFLDNFQGDKSIWVIVTLLSMVSMMAVYSSTTMLAFKNHNDTSSYLLKHVCLMILGYIFMWVMHKVSYQYYSGFWKVGLVLSVVFLLYASLFGAKVNDAGRWIQIPFIKLTFQASDFAKFSLILFLARHMSVYQSEINNLKKVFLPMVAVVVLFWALIFIENISTSVMVLITAFGMIFLGRANLWHLLGTSIIGLSFGALIIAFIFLAPEQYLFKRLGTAKSRLSSFVESKKSFKDVSYQVKLSNIAIASGGYIPNGPGNSRQKNFLPNAFSDYVFAIIVEEWSVFGGIFLILLYLALLYRVIVLVMKSPHTFGALLALGFGLSIVLQAFFNIGVAIGLGPATGVTLPFVSMGGSSVVFISWGLGIILSVSRSVQEGELGQKPSRENYFEEEVSE